MRFTRGRQENSVLFAVARCFAFIGIVEAQIRIVTAKEWQSILAFFVKNRRRISVKIGIPVAQ